MDYEKLADLLFPSLEHTAQEYLTEIYPRRELPEGAMVTRFAPSPTGFIHVGNVFTSMIVERSAHQSGGLCLLRIEDTDKKREIEDGVTGIVRALEGFDIRFDEGARTLTEESGSYGPYTQSRRGAIYAAFCRDLVARGFAYPCFCTEEDLAALRKQQEEKNQLPGYWGEYARCRDLSYEEVERRVRAGEPYTMRLRSPGQPGGRIKFRDVVLGDVEMDDNIVDIVLLKRDGIPTYHFAHAVDDTLMGTTHAIRGNEWLPSVPVHLQLFRVMGLRPMKYVHVSPIMKEENGSKRKLSKRKDPEAAVDYFLRAGYPKASLMEYLLTIANSNFEDWRRQNRELPYTEFPFKLNKLSQSGALFDLQKLDSVSAEVISRFDAQQVYDEALRWAAQYDTELHAALAADADFGVRLFSIDRGGAKPRKDIGAWRDVRHYVAFFYDELKSAENEPLELPADQQKAILQAYLQLPQAADQQSWFAGVRSLCEPLGFSPDVKAYKKTPEAFLGHVGDVSTVIRVAISGRKNTPDLFAVSELLGQARCRARIEAYMATL